MTDTDKRNQEIIEMRNRGKTLNEIGKQFGISKERVRQITKIQPEKQAIAPFEGKLSRRTWHALCRFGIKDRNELEKRLESGLEVKKIRNIGEKTASEIAQYIGREI